MNQALDKAAFWKAFLASFLVYALPLVGPHAVVMLGPSLVMALAESDGARTPWWIAADIALALGLQALAGILWYWFFLSPNWRRLLGVIAAAPALFVIAEWCYVLAFPTYFLIEPDRAPEKASWEVECTIPEHYLVSFRSAPDLPMERAGQAWIARSNDSRLALLEMPGCEVTELNLVWSNVSPRVAYALPDGRAVFATHERTTSQEEWWHVAGMGQEPRRLEKPPHAGHGRPILSTDGGWVAWVQQVPAEDQKRTPRVLLQSLQTSEEKSVSLEALEPARFQLMKLDMAAEDLMLARNEREFFQLALGGAVTWGPWRPEGVVAWEDSFRLLDDGWVAWDAYQENEDYRAAWSFPARAGRHAVLKGRRINSLAVDPSGVYVGISVGGRYSIGGVKDSVYVLRTSDGREVFRRYLKPYSRSDVAFLGSEFFAYTGDREVRVLRIPAF